MAAFSGEHSAGRGHKQDWLGLGVSLLACFGVAVVASLATDPEIPAWYAGLAKPAWTPPNWLFGPVWTTLYAAMAIAAWLVWRRGGWPGHNRALWFFAAQLGLNFAWSFLFFKFHRPDWAFIDIVALWLAIAATTVKFATVSKAAAALLSPYLAWVTFAAALNFAIWRMNA